MSYSKEEVVELFHEFYDDWINNGATLSNRGYQKWLKEKGIIEPELEVGKWYKSGKRLVCYSGTYEKKDMMCGYGFGIGGRWRSGKTTTYGHSSAFREATHEEVEEALIAEAKRRGFKKGCSFVPLNNDLLIREYESPTSNSFVYFDCSIGLTMSDDYSNVSIFNNGKWAEIIENPELEALEKKYKELGEEIDKMKK